MAVPCEPPFCIFRLDYIEMCAWQDSEDKYQAGFALLLAGIETALRGEVVYRAWEHNLRPWDFGALLNEKRHDFCGREWLFDEIDAWRAANSERALLITGDPGTGKTAVVAELVHRNPGEQIIAYHCCQADTPATLQPGRFVRSIAAMIACKLPRYAARLDDLNVAKALSPANSDHDPASAFEEGVLAPLETLPAPEQGVRYLLIDALDEALLVDAEGERSTIVDLLVTRISRLPAWLRVVATTRKDPNVLDRVQGLRAHELNAQDPRNLDDVQSYLQTQLETPNLAQRIAAAHVTTSEAARVIVRRSEGNFLYVQQTLDAIERDFCQIGNLDALPPGLAGLYLIFFERHFPKESGFSHAKTVLQTVVAAQEPLSEDQLARATGLDAEEELPTVLRTLACYLPERDGRYALYHKSLTDWLTEPRHRGRPYYTSPKRGHERLAEACWQQYRGHLERPMDDYAVAHLPYHLLQSGRWQDAVTVLTDLHYVEIKSQYGMTSGLVADYHTAQAGLPCDRSAVARNSPQTVPDVLEAIRAAEGLAIRGDGTSYENTPADQLAAFAAFVSTHSHLLAWTPKETITLARNYSDTGPVVKQAEMESQSLTRPWIARDPRPAVSLHQPACKRTLLGHARWVYGVAVNNDGTIALSASGDGTVRRWNVVSGECVGVYTGHASYVYDVTLTPDGRLAVSASADNTLRVWDIPSGTCLHVLTGHGRSVRGAAVCANGRLAVSCSSDRTLRVWDLCEGKCLRVMEGHTNHVFAVAISADGHTAVSAGGDHAIRIWDTRSGHCLQVLTGHTDLVRSVSITSDGRSAISGSDDGTLRLWELPSGNCSCVFTGHVGPVHAVVLTPDGQVAFSGGRDKTLRVWDVGSGRCLRTLTGHTDSVWDVSVTPDTLTVVSGGYDSAVRVWDVVYGLTERMMDAHTGPVRRIVVGPDCRTVLSIADDPSIWVWDAASGKCLQRIEDPQHLIQAFALTPDGKTVVTAGRDETLRLSELATGRLMRSMTGHGDPVQAVALSPDGQLAISGSVRSLCVWDLKSGTLRARLPGNLNEVNSLGFLPTGRTAVSLSFRSVRLWNAVAGQPLMVLRGHEDRIRGFCTSQDARILITASDDRSVRLWDLASGQCVRILKGHEGGVFSVAVSPDGQTIGSAAEDNTLRLWDFNSGSCRCVLTGHRGLVNWAAFTPNGRALVSASRDRTLRMWDATSGRSLAVFHAEDSIMAVSAITSENWLAVGRKDGQILFLRLQNI